MMNSKFKEGDLVRIVTNELRPSSVGKEGYVVSVAVDQVTKEYLYKIRLIDRVRSLPGWAEEDCLIPIESLRI